MTTSERQLPVRPRLADLRREADEELARAAPLDGDPDAVRDRVARRYGVTDWQRLELACRLIDAIWTDDRDAVRELVTAHPRLLHEDARGVPGNWGPPMSYAANLGRDALVAMLHDLGARDLQHAFDRACLQGRIPTARWLHDRGARPEPDAVSGPAEIQSAEGLALLLELGASIDGAVAMLLETYSRNPDGKHRCLELCLEHGVALPDTPPMAVHRGRIDLLERHLREDSDLLARTFEHGEIWPTELGCHADPTLALHGTPLAGGTLLHLCVDFDEFDIAQWLLDHGADPDASAAVDPDGFGGHTALFGCVVSQTWRVGRRRDAGFARLLLDHGANPAHRASLRKALRFVADETLHEYREVTPAEWGRRFHDPSWVNEVVLRELATRSGRE